MQWPDRQSAPTAREPLSWQEASYLSGPCAGLLFTPQADVLAPVAFVGVLGSPNPRTMVNCGTSWHPVCLPQWAALLPPNNTMLRTAACTNSTVRQ